MNIYASIQSQYFAALAMLEKAVAQCPVNLWNHPDHTNKFWHVAYHAVFYTHLYISPSGADFVPWEKQREHYQFMGTLPWPPHDSVTIEEAYTQDEILAYIAHCRTVIQQVLPTLDLHGESGFEWIPLNKLELQFYTIRHLQHHTGELCDRLGNADIHIEWIGRVDDES